MGRGDESMGEGVGIPGRFSFLRGMSAQRDPSACRRLHSGLEPALFSDQVRGTELGFNLWPRFETQSGLGKGLNLWLGTRAQDRITFV